MAIAVVMKFKGVTLDQYDQVVERMRFERGGPGGPGGLFHWVTQTDDGLQITDVWESKDAFERFAQEALGPHTAAVGITQQPEMTFYDVYNYLTAGDAVHA
jgi:hypothetical protein